MLVDDSTRDPDMFAGVMEVLRVGWTQPTLILTRSQLTIFAVSIIVGDAAADTPREIKSSLLIHKINF